MVLKRRLGDRRADLRFEVSGQLWGAFDRTHQVVLRNIAAGGALVEATLATGVKSVRAARVRLTDGGPALDAVIRHISPLANDEPSERYLVGLEFVNLTTAARAQIDRYVRECDARAGA